MSTAAQGYVGPYPFFHRGATTLHFLEPIEVDTDPSISPGWARPMGWRVATADGLAAWDKTGPLDTDWTPIGTGGGGGITQITSNDGSILITNPTGPIVDLSVVPSGVTLFDVTLSYGHGMDIDAVLPPGISFWLTPTTIADLARADQVREWPVDRDLSYIEIDICVSLTSGIGEGGLPIFVTINGVDTALTFNIPDGITEDVWYSTSATMLVEAGSFVGMRIDGSGVGEAAATRMQVRLNGGIASVGQGLMVVTHDSTLVGSGTVIDPLKTAIRSITGLNGVDQTVSSGNYTLRGTYVVNNETPQAGLLTQDFPGVGREIQATRQFVTCPLFDPKNPAAVSLFDWFGLSDNWKTNGTDVVISGVWIRVHFLDNAAGLTPPTLRLSTDGGLTEVTKTGALAPTAAQILQRFATTVETLIPLPDVVFGLMDTISLVNGTPGFGPGLQVSVDTPATNADLISISVLLALDLVSF